MFTRICILLFWLSGNSCHLFGQKLLYSELKKYTLENVVPTVTDQRSHLESKLSPSEQEKIKKLRWEFREIMRVAKNNYDFSVFQDSISYEMIIYFGNNQDDLEKLILKAWDIAKHHKKTINELLIPLEKKKNKWRKDYRKIIQKYGGQFYRDVKNYSITIESDNRFKEILVPAFFLMWSSKGLVFDYLQINIPHELGAQIYPNPLSGNLVELHISVEQPGTYQVKFINSKTGHLEMSKSYEYNSTGKFNERLDLEDLSTGTYFICITNSLATTIIRFKKM